MGEQEDYTRDYLKKLSKKELQELSRKLSSNQKRELSKYSGDTSGKLEPRIFLKVQDENHMELYYSIYSAEDEIYFENLEDQYFGPELEEIDTPENPSLETPTIIRYTVKVNLIENGKPSRLEGIIKDIPATKQSHTKIELKVLHGHVSLANHGEGSSTAHSRDGDDQ